MCRLKAALLAALFFVQTGMGMNVFGANETPLQYTRGPIVIDHPWSRPTAAGMPVGVAYLSITNNGSRPDTLFGAHSPVAARVEFHRTLIERGMARMRPAGRVVIAARSTVAAEPGGLHLMLIELKEPLVAGTLVPLVLRFETAGEITVYLRVETAPPPG